LVCRLSLWPRRGGQHETKGKRRRQKRLPVDMRFCCTQANHGDLSLAGAIAATRC